MPAFSASTTDAKDSITLTSEGGAQARILLYGAHVVSWQPAMRTQEQLFVSSEARYGDGTALRGGVPVIFPQFADRGPLTKHGFARIQVWRETRRQTLPDGAAEVVLSLRSNDVTRALWPHEFRADFIVTLRDNQLEMALEIHNTDSSPFSFTSALHTYFAIGDIDRTRLDGLQGRGYIDKNAGNQEALDEAAYVQCRGPLDRVYTGAHDTLTLSSPTQHTAINSEGFVDTVVWNPWREGSTAMADMADDEYQAMLCVEAASVMEPVQLERGQRWRGSQTLAALPLEVQR